MTVIRDGSTYVLATDLPVLHALAMRAAEGKPSLPWPPRRHDNRAWTDPDELVGDAMVRAIARARLTKEGRLPR